jgi:hypothetical protein
MRQVPDVNQIWLEDPYNVLEDNPIADFLVKQPDVASEKSEFLPIQVGFEQSQAAGDCRFPPNAISARQHPDIVSP